MVENRDETYIDQQFFLPPSILDTHYSVNDEDEMAEEESDTSVTDSDSTEDTIFVNSDDDETWVNATPESNSQLPIPEGLTVVSQTVKAAAGGGYLVDIVIDIPDFMGVENFDVAVTKA